MRRDIDPIKIIKILPLSNRPGGPQGQPNSWLAVLKKALRATREASVRMLTTVRGQLGRVRWASQSVYQKLISREPSPKREESPVTPTVYQPDAERSVPQGSPVEPTHDLEPRAPSPLSARFMSVRESVLAGWQAQRARLDMMKHTLVCRAAQCGNKIRQAWGTRSTWRNKTEQMMRPLTSAVRSLRRRHQHLLDQLNSTHSIIQNQQQEITELAFHLASIQAELAIHKKTVDELTRELHLLQAQITQSMPATHGTTGQSGPPTHGRRGTAVTKRNGPNEPGAQSTAEH